MGIWEEGRDYKFVAASTAKGSLGPGSKITDGDVLVRLAITPLTTSPGKVSIFDGTGGTEIIIFSGGATSASDLKTFYVDLGIRAANSAANASGPRWLVTTGANVQCVAVGTFH